MSTDRRSCTSTAWYALAVRWLSMLVLALFVFQVGYTPYHLLTQPHFDGTFASSGGLIVHEPGNSDHHDTDHHPPHAASDHLMQMRASKPTSLPVVDFIISEIPFSVTRPRTFAFCVILEEEHIPGESPTEPLQPRAPPLA